MTVNKIQEELFFLWVFVNEIWKKMFFPGLKICKFYAFLIVRFNSFQYFNSK